VLLGVSTLTVRAQYTKTDATKEKSKSKPVFALVALNKLSQPAADDVRKNLEIALGKNHKIEGIEIDEKTVSFKIDGQFAIYGLFNKPIPKRDFEDICKASWIWPEATKALKNHPSHIMVAVMGEEGSHLERNILLTKLLAAAAKTFDVGGVYWAYGSVVVSPAQIQKIAESASADDPPVFLWINFHRHKLSDSTFTLVTEGLEYFNCMEIEVINSKEDPKKILEKVVGVAKMTLMGEVIKDGDSVGTENINERIKTHHARSVRDKSKTVLKIDL
jgi:hypothetical protein